MSTCASSSSLNAASVSSRRLEWTLIREMELFNVRSRSRAAIAPERIRRVEPQIRVRGEVLEFVSLDRPVFETCDAIGSEIGQTLTDCAIPEWVAQISSTPELEYRFLSFKLSATVISRLFPSLDSIAELLR